MYTLAFQWESLTMSYKFQPTTVFISLTDLIRLSDSNTTQKKKTTKNKQTNKKSQQNKQQQKKQKKKQQKTTTQNLKK